MHLLILDDEEPIRTFVADVATGAGWTAETARHKGDFRSQFFRRLPDAVILDLHLGETDGISEMRFLAQWAVSRTDRLDERFRSTRPLIGSASRRIAGPPRGERSREAVIDAKTAGRGRIVFAGEL